MIVTLKNNTKVVIRLLKNTDTQDLFNYLSDLSSETKSRFGPHPFDRASVETICNNLNDDVLRYIAVDESGNNIIAYMLLKQGMIIWDEKRYAGRNRQFNYQTTITFAPSVADAWQSTGLGTMMYQLIEEELKAKGIQHIILWGGVQATNERAVNFYKKLGYLIAGSYWHDEKDNYDMVKEL